jgi:hypothetical protein
MNQPRVTNPSWSVLINALCSTYWSIRIHASNLSYWPILIHASTSSYWFILIHASTSSYWFILIHASTSSYWSIMTYPDRCVNLELLIHHNPCVWTELMIHLLSMRLAWVTVPSWSVRQPRATNQSCSMCQPLEKLHADPCVNLALLIYPEPSILIHASCSCHISILI